MPDRAKYILSTKHLDSLLISEASEKNIFIDAIPFIKTVPIISSEILEKLKEYADKNIIAIFTSVQAAKAVYDYLEKPVSWNIYCTGGATKEFVQANFSESFICGTGKNANEIAAKIINEKKASEVYFFCGDKRLNTLPDLLSNNDIKVNEIICYQTIHTPVIINKNYDAVLYFSPSAVESFFSINKIRDSISLYAIGETTASAIKKFSNNKILIAENPSKEEILKLILESQEIKI